jgi:hypothetical protein
MYNLSKYKGYNNNMKHISDINYWRLSCNKIRNDHLKVIFMSTSIENLLRYMICKRGMIVIMRV